MQRFRLLSAKVMMSLSISSMESAVKQKSDPTMKSHSPVESTTLASTDIQQQFTQKEPQSMSEGHSYTTGTSKNIK